MTSKKNQPSYDKDQIKQLYQAAVNERDALRSEFESAYYYTFPHRRWGKPTGTNIERDKLYDPTATDCVNTLKANVTKFLIPRDRKWASLETVNEDVKLVIYRKAELYRQKFEDVMHKHLIQSRFYPSIDEVLIDLIVIGTGCLAIINRGNSIDYRSIPIDQMAFTTNAIGEIDCVFREYHYTGRQALQMFGDILPSADKARAMQNADAPFEICESIIPDGDYYWKYVYIKNSWEEISREKTKWNPYIICRWSIVPSLNWGESPVRQALPAIKVTNQIVHDQLQAADYAAFGLWYQTTDPQLAKKIKGKVTPGSMLYIPGGDIKALQFPGQWEISEQMLQTHRGQIKALLMDKLAPYVTGTTPPSAEQAAQLKEQLINVLGSPATMLEGGCLQPATQQSWERMVDKGIFEKPTERDYQELQAALGMPFSKVTDLFQVNVDATITQVSKQVDALRNIGAVGQAADLEMKLSQSPEVARLLRKDTFFMDTLTKLGLNQIHLKTEDEIAAEDEAAAQQAAALAQQQQQSNNLGQANVLADTIQKAAKGVQNLQQPKGPPR